MEQTPQKQPTAGGDARDTPSQRAPWNFDPRSPTKEVYRTPIFDEATPKKDPQDSAARLARPARPGENSPDAAPGR